MSELKIKSYEFSKDGNEHCKDDKRCKDWPVVYLINNDKEIYVGETSHFYNRFKQHLDNPARRKLNQISVVLDDEFNKSAVLDIEQSLIQYIGAENKFKLQNMNGGQSSKHNYYQRAVYLAKLDKIWTILNQKGLTDKTLLDIQNTNLFKFSPYNSLNQEQNEVCNDVLANILTCLDKGESGTSVIHGGAGTGKTVVLINIIYKILNAAKFNIDPLDESLDIDDENIKTLLAFKEYTKQLGRELKIAFVVPMDSIRHTIKTVFAETKSGLKPSIVVGPLDITKDKYDIIFVDEAHRLPRNKNIMYADAYRDACNRLGLDWKEDTTLDMIVKSSKYRVLVYDDEQRVKETDITPDQFGKSISNSHIFNHYLDTQMRCRGGQPYVNYIRDILSVREDLSFKEVENYDFRLFDNVDEMVQGIKAKNAEFGLCLNVAGYAWKWISKNQKSYEDVIRKGLEDITIQGHKYVWNMNKREFILSKNAVNEIGCIHTTQGYDLNYVGVIFGPEIDYDSDRKEITINLSKFYDSNVKRGASYEDVKAYIINAYRTMMARGILGCYVYACNDNLREYLRKYIPSQIL